MARKLTIKEVARFVKENSNCILLSKEYKNNITRLNFKCGCGNEFTTTYAAFRGNGVSIPKRQCDQCGKEILLKKITKYDLKFVENFIAKKGCKLISEEYKNVNQKIQIQCNCGNIFETTFSHFKDDGQVQCNECGYLKTSKALLHDFQYIENHINTTNGCKLITRNYSSQLAKLEIRCRCGKVFRKTFKDFSAGQTQCNYCAGRPEYTIKDIKKYVHENTNTIVLSESYINMTEKLNFLCKCGRTFERNFDSFKYHEQHTCVYCSKGSSKSELKIAKFLDRKNVHYIPQHTFKDCRNIHPLHFDFYLPKKNLCIEYDGEMHYKETTLGNDLKRQQLHDKIKNKYCKDNNINLLRIPYWEKNNIETILKSVLT